MGNNSRKRTTTRTPAATATTPRTRNTADGAKADLVQPGTDLNKADTGAGDRTATVGGVTTPDPTLDTRTDEQRQADEAAAAEAERVEAERVEAARVEADRVEAARVAADKEHQARLDQAAKDATAAEPKGRERTFHVLRRHDGPGVSYGTQVDADANPSLNLETTRKAAPADVDHLVRLGVLGAEKPKAEPREPTSMAWQRPAPDAE